MSEYLLTEVIDMTDAHIAIRQLMLGAPLVSKTTPQDPTDTGVTLTGTGTGIAYIRPKVGATIDDYVATVTVLGGNATRDAGLALTLTFNAAARTVQITTGLTDWTTDHSVVAGNFVQFRGTASNDRNGKCYRVLSVGGTGNDTITLETTEAVTDETAIACTAYRWHSGVVFNLRRDPGGANVDLGHFTSGRGAIFEDTAGLLRLQLRTTVPWVVSDTLSFDLIANALVGQGEDWTANEVLTTSPDANLVYNVESYFEGPGISGTEAINVNLRNNSNFAADQYTIEFRGSDGYIVSSEFNAQPNTSRGVYISGTSNPMFLWVTVSGDRVAGVLRAQSGVFEHFYGGFGDPLADTVQYARPLLIGGSNTVNAQPGDTNHHHSAYWDPVADLGGLPETTSTPTSLTLRYLDGTWYSGLNKGEVADAVTLPSQLRRKLGFIVSPRAHSVLGTNTSLVMGHDENLYPRIVPAVGDNYLMSPMTISTTDPGSNVLMDFQGVFFVTGFGASSEDTITIGSDEYVLFNNVNKSGQGDFAALRLTGP